MSLAWIVPIAFVWPHRSTEKFLSLFWIGVPNVIQFLELVNFFLLSSHLVKVVTVCHHRIINLFLVPGLKRGVVSLVSPEEIPDLSLVKVLIGPLFNKLCCSDFAVDATSHSLLSILI